MDGKCVLKCRKKLLCILLRLENHLHKVIAISPRFVEIIGIWMMLHVATKNSLISSCKSNKKRKPHCITHCTKINETSIASNNTELKCPDFFCNSRTAELDSTTNVAKWYSCILAKLGNNLNIFYIFQDHRKMKETLLNSIFVKKERSCTEKEKFFYKERKYFKKTQKRRKIFD